jgi:hypothetical protein
MTSDTPPDGAQPRSSELPAARKPIHRRPDRVVLQADVAADGSRNLSVEREGNDVVIRGHDLGPVVTRAFGPGTSEYEWAWRIPAASLPALRAALDGQPAMTRSSSCAAGRWLTRAGIQAALSSALTSRSSSGTG